MLPIEVSILKDYLKSWRYIILCMFNVYKDNNMYKVHSTESATLLYAPFTHHVSVIRSNAKKRERELEKGQEVV